MKFAVLALFATLLSHAQTDQKGSLRGKFVDDLFQQGVAKARVTLTGNGLREPLVFDTDASGTFSLASLTPGSYSMAVTKAGFFAPDPRTITIEASGALNLGDITLLQNRGIRGKVRWQDGTRLRSIPPQFR